MQRGCCGDKALRCRGVGGEEVLQSMCIMPPLLIVLRHHSGRFGGLLCGPCTGMGPALAVSKGAGCVQLVVAARERLLGSGRGVAAVGPATAATAGAAGAAVVVLSLIMATAVVVVAARQITQREMAGRGACCGGVCC